MADLKQIPNRDAVVADDDIVSPRWLKWLTELREAVNRLIVGTFDYEEGAVTPLTSPNIVYASGGLRYQKIGSWVHVVGFVEFPATADANQAAINNLPFASANVPFGARGGCVCPFTTAGVSAGLVVTVNSNTATFVNPATAGALTNAALTTAFALFDFRYPAAA